MEHFFCVVKFLSSNDHILIIRVIILSFYFFGTVEFSAEHNNTYYNNTINTEMTYSSLSSMLPRFSIKVSALRYTRFCDRDICTRQLPLKCYTQTIK